MKNKFNLTIGKKIIIVFTISLTIIFGSLIYYMNYIVRPNISNTTIKQSLMLVESKSSEVGMWINRKVNEFRILSEVPAIKSADVRGIIPLIENLTDSFKYDGDTMETFSYGGINSYSGFNWVNAEAILDLIVYEDYQAIINDKKEYAIGNPIITKDNREVMLFYYPIKGYGDEYEGLLCSAIPTVRLKEIVNSMRIYNGKTWIMNKNGDIITTSPSYFYKRILDKSQLEKLIKENNMSELGFVSTKNVQNEKSSLFYSPVPYSEDWIFCTLVNNKDIYEGIDGAIVGLSIIFMILLILDLFIGYTLSESVVTPIKNLQHQMDLVEQGNMQAYYTQETHDEIYNLGNSYNKMLDEINRLIERIYTEERKKRKAELSVLQGQIKPHFLYNTLDNLKWMAKEYGAEDIAKTITSLSTFFRVLLSNGEEEITLKQEFKHTKSYLDIQQTRYSNVLDYEIYLEKEIENIKIVKILVQPLVENAIYHGIKSKKGKGTIKIKGIRNEDKIVITVEDNGIGMMPETLEELRNNISVESKSEHYGLHNIYERLVMEYGTNADISIESEYTIGTKVTITIPFVGGNEENVQSNSSR